MEGSYGASRYYRESPRKREKRLSRNDRVYRGSGGRYTCRRPDETTGLVIGAIVCGVAGSGYRTRRSVLPLKTRSAVS